MLKRYAVVRICSDGEIIVESRHVFLFAALDRLEKRQNDEYNLSWIWGNQMGLTDEKTGVLITVKEMIKAGAAEWRREEGA